MNISTSLLATNVQASNSIMTNIRSNRPTSDLFIESIFNTSNQKMTTSSPSSISMQQAADALTTSTELVLPRLGKSSVNDDSHHLGRKLLSVIFDTKPKPKPKPAATPSSSTQPCDQNSIPMLIRFATDTDVTRMITQCEWENTNSQNPYTGFTHIPANNHRDSTGAVKYIPADGKNFLCTTTRKSVHSEKVMEACVRSSRIQDLALCNYVELDNHYLDLERPCFAYLACKTDYPFYLGVASTIYQDCKSSKPIDVWMSTQLGRHQSVDLTCIWDECHPEPPCGSSKSERRKIVTANSDACLSMQIPSGAKTLQCELAIKQSGHVQQKLAIPTQNKEESQVANANGECNTLFIETQGTPSGTEAACFPQKYTSTHSGTGCEKAANRDCIVSQEADIWVDIQTHSAKSSHVDLQCEWEMCQPITPLPSSSQGSAGSQGRVGSKTVTLSPKFSTSDFCVNFSVPKGAQKLRCDMTVHQRGSHAHQKIDIGLPKRRTNVVNPRGECGTLFIQSTVKATAKETASNTHSSCYPLREFSEGSIQPETRCDQTLSPEEYLNLYQSDS